MKLERALQADHSDYMRVVASFADEETAERVHEELVRHMEELFARGDGFRASGFGQSFESEEKFREWKKKEWDPTADERCTLEVKREDGRIYARGDYGLVLDDWCRQETAVGLDENVVAVRTYTAGYGLDYLDQWLSEKGGMVNVYTEGEELGFVPFETVAEELQAAPDAEGAGRVRAEDGDGDPS